MESPDVVLRDKNNNINKNPRPLSTAEVDPDPKKSRNNDQSKFNLYFKWTANFIN